MKRGPKPTTGRYETREELERQVLYYWGLPGYKQATIARIVRVSPATVAKIIERK